MECIEFIKFISEGSTRPFIVKDNKENKWVVKVIGNPLGNKAIFDELIIGKLAKIIQLPWPDVTICHLSPQIIRNLENNKQTINCEWAVAIKYIDDLQNIDWPKGGYDGGKNFGNRNKNHLENIFINTEDFDCFYGKAMFDNWVLLEDTKYDTLKKIKNGAPIFLDASRAFGGFEWKRENLKWNQTGIALRYPYLPGIINEYSRFEKWIKKLNDDFQVSLLPTYELFPSGWKIPKEYYQSLIEFMTSTQKIFIPLFRNWVDFEILTNE